MNNPAVPQTTNRSPATIAVLLTARKAPRKIRSRFLPRNPLISLDSDE
jgi:hypothetical protein